MTFLQRFGAPVLRAVLRTIFRVLNKTVVTGMENAITDDRRAVYIANHVSFLDAALLAAFLPGNPTFAVNTFAARWWWMRLVMPFFNCITIDPTNPMATKTLIKLVQSGHKLVIFPEGRLTVTGALMKVYDGPGMIADKADAVIVPIRLDGVQFSPFSRLKGKMPLHWFPDFKMTILPPQRFAVSDGMVGRARRREIGNKLYDVMVNLIFDTAHTDRTLFRALIDSRKSFGSDTVVADDINRSPLTYDRLLVASYVMGHKFAQFTDVKEHVGILLPNSVATLVTFFGLQEGHRVPAMLNFSTGIANMLSAVDAAAINTVITSRMFVEKAKMEETIAAFTQHGMNIVYLEDIKASVTVMDKVRGFFKKMGSFDETDRSPRDPAVILFTSGSEGVPKGVALSHQNLLSNIYQLAARVDFNSSDIVFNALPLFHSFGLTGGMLLPVLNGIKSFLYPSPLHYKIVPELVYDVNATIMFGTDTFLTGYAKHANPYDLYSIRYIFAGAEKVKDSTRAVYMEKFGKRVLEGYGSTECSPVISTNTAMQYKAGTVGRLLPRIEYRLEVVPGVDRGGRLHVYGPNVMAGYLTKEHPGKVVPPVGGWYDTGDIVDIDHEGFITILGRAKRFAKIAGEMVSLTAVEAFVSQVWPNEGNACIAVPDDRKGERLVLFTTVFLPDDNYRATLVSRATDMNVNMLMVPSEIRVVDAIPLLGTGKTDYNALKNMV